MISRFPGVELLDFLRFFSVRINYSNHRPFCLVLLPRENSSCPPLARLFPLRSINSNPLSSAPTSQKRRQRLVNGFTLTSTALSVGTLDCDSHSLLCSDSIHMRGANVQAAENADV